MMARIYERTGIHPAALDEDAVRVVRRLRRKDHETYLVGGCVRDLLLGRVPKDFDIATSARPRQVKGLFRNCRIIGRRFKLAHLHFEGKILEVSTFRQRPKPSEEDEVEGEAELLIRSDNEFGNAEEDAYRRDFTINALFYEPESDMVIDYVEGIPDLQNGLIRTIGEPLIRLKEDPIRILRAIKFSSRLAFQIEPATWEAMREAAPDLKLGAPPRIYEELLRFLKSGFALHAFQLLRDSGSLEVLLPDLHESLKEASPEERMRFWRMLEGLDSVNRDKLAKEGSSLPTSTCLASLLLFHVEQKAKGDTVPERLVEHGRWIQDQMGDLFRDLNTPENEVSLIKKIIPLQDRFEGDGDSSRAQADLQKEEGKAKQSGRKKTKKGRRRRSPKTSDAFKPALDLLRVRAVAGLVDWEVWESWKPKEKTQETPPSTKEDQTTKEHRGSERSVEEKAQEEPKLKMGDRNEGRNRKGGRREGSGRSRGSSRSRSSQGSDSRRSDSRRSDSRRSDSRKANSRGSDSRGSEQNASRGSKRTSSKRGSDRNSQRKGRRGSSREKKSYFPPLPEIDLDPNEIPTYGSIVGDTTSIDKNPPSEDRPRKKKKKPKMGEGDAHDETHYIPPPPPDADTGPKAPNNDPDVFGDW